MSKDLAEWCGYTSVFDMLKDNLTNDELLDLLCEYIHEDSSGVSDIIEEIAKEKMKNFIIKMNFIKKQPKKNSSGLTMSVREPTMRMPNIKHTKTVSLMISKAFTTLVPKWVRVLVGIRRIEDGKNEGMSEVSRK